MSRLRAQIAVAFLLCAGASAPALNPPTPLTPLILNGSGLSGAASALAAPGQSASAQSAPPDGAAQATATMQTFTSADGRFSVLLPGTPKQETQQVSLQGGGASTLYEFSVDLENDNVTYMVMYNDYPANYANEAPQTTLARTRDGAAKDKTLTSDTAIDLNGVPGRAFTLTDKDGWLYSVHQFLNGKRLYQLIEVNSKDHPATLTDQFMNSFRMF